MEVDPPNVTANPDKFQKLISFGQKVLLIIIILVSVKAFEIVTR